MFPTLSIHSPKRSIVIDNDFHQALQIQSEIIATIERYHPDDAELAAIRLALEEAMVNAVTHGNQSDPGKKLHIDYEVGDTELRIRIEDEGPGFDPRSLPDPTLPEYRQRPRGRGIFLMRHCMTQVNFLGRGNCVEMVRRLNGAHHASRTSQNNPLRQPTGANSMDSRNVSSNRGPSLASVFTQDCIVKIPEGTTKKAALELMLNTLATAYRLPPLQVPVLLETLLDRERTGSTAIGRGLAMPHLRTEAVLQFVGAVGLAPQGINFQSLDGAPTKLILLVIAPHDDRERHIELMGRLSALMRDKSTLMFLQGNRTPLDVFEYLSDLDARSEAGSLSPSNLGTNTASSRSASPIGASRG